MKRLSPGPKTTWGRSAQVAIPPFPLSARVSFSASILLSAYGACEIDEYGRLSSPFSMSLPSYTTLPELM